MVRLLITGSPGVGKTTVAMELSKALNATLININEVIRPLLKWDPGLSTNYVIDEKRARELIKGRLSGLDSYIIDTVAINLIDRELIDWCIVLRLNPVELMRRLLLRNWPRCKVVENVLAEVVGSSLSMAIDLFGKDRVIEVDTTNKGVQDIVKYIISHVSSGNSVIGVVDWLDVLDTDFLISLSRELDGCQA
ncbi:adenylate kinase family protein [Vulcanisaeta sp. JCM 14467]|uniref:adenylate kinase family protein n=1 Tax=Vulcanisaeta sp. JCM 14467 TaxID=1295370 RepID=UPI0006D27633|nr:AAA family ATPase [Vulcanisaeta sp. JCM 14467]